MSPRSTVIAFAVALLARAPHVVAEPSETRFVLEYMAPTTCPSLSGFTDAIVRRAPNASVSTPGPGVFVFRARVEEDGGLHAGRLSVEIPGGATTERVVAPAACGDVVETMAVIIALIVAGNDPSTARTGAPSEPTAGAIAGTLQDLQQREDSGSPPAPAAEAQPSPRVSPQPNRVPALPAAKRVPALPAPKPEATVQALPSRTPQTSSDDRGQRSTRRGQTLGFALGSFLEQGATPDLTPGIKAALDLAFERPGPWSPSARLGVIYSRDVAKPTAAGTPIIRLVALRANACPLRVPFGPALAARGCAVFDVGELRGQARNVNVGTPQTQKMLWVGGGAAARFEARLAEVLGLEAELGALLLGRADRFVFAPDSELVHQVPRVSLGASLGLVLNWP